MKKTFKNFLWIFYLIVISVLSHLVWFVPGSILSSGDIFFQHKESMASLIFNNTWVGSDGLGRVNIQGYKFIFIWIHSVLSTYGLHYTDILRVTHLIPISILGFVSPFILIRYFTKNNLIAAVGAVFFGSTTPFIMRQYLGHLSIAFVISITPLILYYFVLAIKKNKTKNWIIFILLYWIGSCYEIRMVYIVSIVLAVYFVFFYPKNKIDYLKNILISMACFIFLSFFWILPTGLGGYSNDIQEVAGRSVFGDGHYSMLKSFALFHDSWTGRDPIEFSFQSIQIYFWILPITIISFFVVGFKSRKISLKIILFFSVVLLLGLIITKQSGEPFISSFRWMRESIPGFLAFRSGSKFWFLVSLGYLGLLSFGLLAVRNKSRKIFNLIAALLFLVFLFNLKPLISGQVKGLFEEKKIPNDYIVLKKWLQSSDYYFRSYFIPTRSRWAFYSDVKPIITAESFPSSDLRNNLGIGDPAKNSENLFVLLEESLFAIFFDISSIKYVIVPIQDIANDDDFFINYGGKENPNIRQWYIDEMDKISWLKKIDIGTTELVIYENENYKPPIFAFNSLLKFNALSNLEEKYDFAVNDLKKDFYFVSDGDGLENKNTLAVNNIFENITPANLENSKIRVDLGEASGEKLLYSKDASGKLFLNGSQIDLGGEERKEIALNAGENVFEYENENFKFENLIDNGSFENGAWGEEVGDCSNYDENPILKMGLNKAEKTEGEQSLQLEATRHNACVSKKLPVKENSSYLFSFDYQSPNSKIASYYLAFDDEAKTVFSENIDLKGEGWQNFSKVIKAPVGATKLSLYVYAKQSNGKENVINRYDNFKLIEVPDLSNAFYLVDKEERKFEEPKAVDFDLINPTKKLVHVRGVKTPFYLAMSESFHPQWQLQMNNEKIQGYLNKWWPFVKPDRVRDEYHYKLDDFLNAWYVDPAEMCAKNRACVKHSDGSYDMEMTLEFFPQRWFYLGLIISVTTLLGCLGHLVWAGRKGIAEFFGKIAVFFNREKRKKKVE